MDIQKVLAGAMLALWGMGCTYHVLLGDAEGQASAPDQQGDVAPSVLPSSAPVEPAAIKASDPPAPIPPQPSMAAAVTPPVVSMEDDCEQPIVSTREPCQDDPDPCGLNSGYPGDEYCLLPPDPDQGVQIHLGPRDHADPQEIAKYLIDPGNEINDSVLAHVPLDRAHWWDRIEVQMRPGMHHWQANQVAEQPEERFYASADCGGAAFVTIVGGGHELVFDGPPLGVAAPENDGLGYRIEAAGSLCMNLHAYNFDDDPHLREAWINLYYGDEAKLTQRAGSIRLEAGSVGLDLPPGQSTTVTHEVRAPGAGRIIQLFGRANDSTLRLAAWLNDALIYDSWLPVEGVTYNYDTLTQNPLLDTANRTNGALSGPILVNAGDSLKFSCFIENDSNRTLTFGDFLGGGELCDLFGRSVGAEFVEIGQ